MSDPEFCAATGRPATEEISLRDWFAGQAVGAVIHQCAGDTPTVGATLEEHFAHKAYAVADALLAARQSTSSSEG